MATVPESRLGRLTFYEGHIPDWTANVGAIGLEAQQVVDLNALTGAARDAYDAMVIARQASKNATLAWHNAADAMHANPGAGADMIRDIRNFALSTDDDNVYVLAGIPAPAEPTPVGPPGMPTSFAMQLLPNGSLTLSWKCDNPAGSTGTTYEVERRIDGVETDFSLIGTAGSREFNDATIPPGTSSVSYQVTAMRSTAKGIANRVTVAFGGGGGEAGITAVANAGGAGGAVKLAA